MRGMLLAFMLAGCAQQGAQQGMVHSGPLAPDQLAAIERMRTEAERRRLDRAAAEGALTPAQRGRRELDAARVTRENELLERAASASPDYTAAVRRAAVANVDGEAAIPPAQGARRRPAVNPRTRDAAITAEEARLSEAVEIRRRQRLNEQAGQMRGQQDQQAAANCVALGQTIEASMFNPRSFLNLEGAIAGVQARDNCWNNYQQSRR